jgi:hypothetical protein
MLILYKNDDGVAIVVPSPEALSLYGIDAIAKKDVPYGTPYKLVTELPEGDRATWEITEYDGVGEDYGAGSDNLVVGWKDGEPMVAQ